MPSETEGFDSEDAPDLGPLTALSPQWRIDLAFGIGQLIGWAKAGQRPEYPAKPRFYILDAENTDRLRDDILNVVDKFVPVADPERIRELEAELATARRKLDAASDPDCICAELQAEGGDFADCPSHSESDWFFGVTP